MLLKHVVLYIKTTGWFLILLLVCSLINTLEAGVIKKRDIDFTATTETNNKENLSVNLTEAKPTILSAIPKSEVVTTKLQLVAGANFATESSKELTNNEILLNEAKKLLAEEDKIIENNKETELKKEKEEEKEEEEEKKEEKSPLEENVVKKSNLSLETKQEDNLQDIKEIIKNLENKEQQLSDSPKIINVVKEDCKENEDKQEKEESSLENSLKSSSEEKPRPPSKILTELKTDSEDFNKKSQTQESQLENSIEHLKIERNNHIKQEDKDTAKGNLETNTDKSLNNEQEVLNSNGLDTKVIHISIKETKTLINEEQDKEELNSKTLDSQEQEKNHINTKILETKTLVTNDQDSKEILDNENNKNDLKYKTLESQETENQDLKSKTIETQNEEKRTNDQETSLSVAQVTDHKEVLEITSINPIKENKEFSSKTENSLKEDYNKNKIQDNIDQEQLLKNNEVKISIKTTTSQPEIVSKTALTTEAKEEDLLIFEGDKKEFARSMSNEDFTTNMPLSNNEVLMPVTTYRPVILSVNEEDLKDDDIQDVGISVLKEKKPKFINDNSTNAQQLNLPNNMEVWSLAGMKSLPKESVARETEQAHNQTEKEVLDIKPLEKNDTIMMINTNSEKNLLDWSQIMMDKELSTTTRNEEIIREHMEEKENHLELPNTTRREEGLEDITTLRSELNDLNNKPLKKEEEVTINSLREEESMLNKTNQDTILSFANNNSNETDKNFEIKEENETNMNHRELIRELEATTTTATTNINDLYNMVNNPLNATLNIEPNLNEKINLTLNQTHNNNNEMHTTTTAGNLNLKSTLTDTIAQTLTSTETTAVAGDTTTVEQISSETTTVSTVETSKANASLLLNNFTNLTSHIENLNNFNNNVNIQPTNYTTEHSELEITTKYNQYNIEAAKTTTTVLPITTFSPSILAITSTTSKPVTFEQEIVDDQNGNNEFQIKNLTQHSILANDNSNSNNNSMKISETHLGEREFDTTTTITTLATIIETLNTTTAKTLAETENTLVTTTITNTPTTTTSSSQEITLINVTSESSLTNKEELEETTLQTTPKTIEQTTIGSVNLDNEHTENKLNISTTTSETLLTTTTPNTPVVFETSSAIPPTVTTTTTTEQNIPLTSSSAIPPLVITTTTEQNIPLTTLNEEQQEIVHHENNSSENNEKLETTTMSIIASTTLMPVMVTTENEETYISLLDDSTTTSTSTQAYSPSIIPTTTTTTTLAPTTTEYVSSSTSPPPPSSPPTIISTTTSLPSAITTKVEEIYNVIHSTTTELIQTTTQHLITETEDESTSTSTIPPPETTTPFTNMINTADIDKSLPTLTSIMGGNSGNMYPKNSEATGETDVNVIIAITVSVIGVIALILLVGFLYLMRKRQKQNSYPNRCRPVSMDEFTIDNASVGGSMRKSSALRSSKRTYGNLAFDDPSLRHNPMGVHELAKFVQERLRIFEEFRDVPQITSRLDEIPPGCEDKNRYANVLPLPETRVILQRLNDDDKTEYINANYVTGPKDPPNYYIACQAPLESTVEDFWRMIWEQQSRVIIQATDLIENGVEKCAEYLPPSVTLDNHSTFGDFQITLQNREVKDKYAISTILLKNINENTSRELTHYWYKWPEVGVPSEEAPIIAMLLEARSSLISYAIEQANEDKEKSSTATLKSAEEGTVRSSPTKSNSNGSSANGSSGEINGNISMVHIKKTARNQGPLTIHCSPGTGRTGTIIACDIAIRSLETPKRTVDIPQIVYYVRRGRASAVLTKEQYEFIYKVANMYAAKITNPTNYN